MPNAVTALLDDHVAAGDGARTVIVTPSGHASYADVLARTCRFGHALRALGVEPEHRVAILLPDGVDWAAAFLGVIRIGAVAVPLNTRLAPERWAAMLADSRARVVVADDATVAALAPYLPALPRLRPITTDAAQTAPDALAAEPVSDDDMAFWLYTSGTTGPPRAAPSTSIVTSWPAAATAKACSASPATIACSPRRSSSSRTRWATHC